MPLLPRVTELDRQDAIIFPGATKSGLILPSLEGPILLKSAIADMVGKGTR